LRPQLHKERLDFGSKVKARGIRLPPCLPSRRLSAGYVLILRLCGQ